LTGEDCTGSPLLRITLESFLIGAQKVKHVYEIRPRRDRRGFDLISDALPFGRLWYLKVAENRERIRVKQRAATQ
jgi:hypothetical protein